MQSKRARTHTHTHQLIPNPNPHADNKKTEAIQTDWIFPVSESLGVFKAFHVTLNK